VPAASIIRVEAASTSEMSVNFYQTTWRYIPEDSHLHTLCHENLKSQDVSSVGSSALTEHGRKFSFDVL
jgi:hypothetical protein